MKLTPPKLVDVHAHICDPCFDHDRDQVLERARKAGVEAIIAVGENLEDALKNIELSEKHPALKPAAGLYPTCLDLNLAHQMAAFIRRQRFSLVANVVDVVPTDAPLPKLPVARAYWSPRPGLKTAAAAWIYAGGAHHTSFSYSVTAAHLRDFAEMAALEFLLIDENTKLDEFKKELRWNDLYYQLNRSL